MTFIPDSKQFVKRTTSLISAGEWEQALTLIGANQRRFPKLSSELRLMIYSNSQNQDDLELEFDQYISTYSDIDTSNLLAAATLKFELGKYQEAIRICERVIDHDHSNFEAATLIYKANINRKDYYSALSNCQMIIAEAGRLARPETELVHYRLQEIIPRTMIGQYAEVTKLWESLVHFETKYPDHFAEVLLGCYLQSLVALNRLRDAKDFLVKRDLENSEDPHLLLIIPNLWQQLGDKERCVKAYNKLLEARPELIEPQWNYSLALLAMGELAEGTRRYESRWKWDDFPSSKRRFSSPQWKGEDLKGKSIIVWGEQGVGDQLLFLTLLPFVLEQKPAEVIVEVSTKLVPLVERWYPEVKVRDDLVKDTVGQFIYDNLDFQIPSGSLMGILFSATGSICGKRRHLVVPENIRDELLPVSFKNKRVIVGVSWRSHWVTETRSGNYLNVHSIVQLRELLPSNIGFVCLQYRLTNEERDLLSGYEDIFIPDADFFENVDSNALYAGCCDLVFTAATVVLQLAGIYGRPILTWLPKQDWVLLGQEHYPWFDNVVVVRGDPYWDQTSMYLELVRKLKIILKLS